MLWDISPALDAEYQVFPGDTPLSLRPTWTLGADSPVNVFELTATTHLGAHIDAPLHLRADGVDAAGLDLAPFLGPCRVVHALAAGLLLTRDHLSAAFDDTDPDDPRPPRLLVRTYRRQPRSWTDDFTAWAPELVTELGGRGVVLIGTDAASLDPADSKTLSAHHAAIMAGLAILENLVLDDVPPGDYELIALPLKLVGADAAPVRAVLRELRQ